MISAWSGIFSAELTEPVDEGSPGGLIGTPIERAFESLGFATGHDRSKRFEPHGLSWVRVREGKACAIHTWPEFGLVTVDLYGGPHDDVEAALTRLGWLLVEDGHVVFDAFVLRRV